MTQAKQIEQIEITIEEAKEKVRMGNMADKLASIPEFQAVILKGFMEQETLRMNRLINEPNLPAEFRELSRIDVQAGPTLFRYLQRCVQEGRIAEQTIADHEEELEELRESEDGVEVFGGGEE